MKRNLKLHGLLLERRSWIILLVVLWGLVPLTSAFAQGLSVSGKITTINGEPVPGATIVVKGTINGTVSDADGNFVVDKTSSQDVLIFSFVGMKIKEIEVGNNTSINVVMEEEAIGIGEVVAIGYGTAKKKDLTGSISALSGDNIVARQNTQIVTALQGALPGVTVTRSSSAPGTSGTIRVRGITSIQESDPLIIVDGVPAYSINDVNSADIENITVLKDAASASIYGARAAAGVILITTKRGASNNESIEYNYSYSMDIPTEMPDYADAVTYMKVLNELNWNDNPAGGENTIYEQELIENYWSLNKTNSDLYPNTDWVDLCLKSYAPRQSHQLSFSNGKDKYRTKMSIGYDDVEGLFKENLSWDRITARLNNDMSFREWLTSSVDIYLKRTTSVDPYFSPSLRMRYAAPIYPAVYSDGRLAGGKDGENPYGKMMYGGTTEGTANQAGGKISLNVTPLKGLILTGTFAPIYNFSKSKAFNKQATYYTAWDDNTATALLDGTETTDLKETRTDSYSLTSQFFANYSKKLLNHNLNLMAGYENYYYFHETVWASRGEYALTYYPYLAAGPGDLKDNNGDAYENAYRSFFGRLMYNWNSKYYLQANLRYDGSSRFNKDYRWGAFPSLSAGWVMSEESFLKDVTLVSYLKLRASWGQLGNERIGNYPYQSTLAFNSPTLYVGNTVVPVQGASAYQYAVRDITWETTETTDIGLDVNILDNRLHFSGDYYKKQTKDMLLELQIPNYMGYSDPFQNAGKMETKGWDIEMSWSDNINDFHYSVSLNLSDYKTVMGNLNDTQVLSGNLMIREGSQYKEWYGYVSDGIFQSADEITEATPVTSSAVTVGDIKYKDISGPEGVPDGQIDATYDRVLLGGSLPRYNYGGSVNMAYKGFDFLLSFQGVGKRKSMLTDEMVQPIRADWYNVPEIIVGKYWSQYNTSEQNANAEYPRVSRTGITNNYAASDFWLFDGSYLRIKNITLGYSVPESLLNRVEIEKLRFYLSLQDFFTFSHFPKGWDPEVSSTGYPITKSVTFGVSLKF